MNLSKIIIAENKCTESNIKVYLFDEQHEEKGKNDDLNKLRAQSTDENIEIAEYLISNENIQLIGVEGFKSKNMFGEEISPKTSIGNYTKFADTVKSKHPKLKIVGLEDEELEADCLHIDNIFKEERNPLYYYRSIMFIKILFNTYNIVNGKGNIILNCGLKHNDDIWGLINNKKISYFTGVDVNYYRIRNEVLQDIIDNKTQSIYEKNQLKL